MIDTSEQIAHWSLVREPLEECAKVILPAYREIDESAMWHQWWHRRLAITAASMGTIAVLIAIFQLAAPATKALQGIGILEGIAALLALFAVLIGILLTGRSRWLLERHKAERLRLLKFLYLMDRDVWCEPEKRRARTEGLTAEVQAIRAMKYREFQEWAEELGEASIPPPPRECPISGEALEQLVEYYRAKRVVHQRLFFADRALRNVPMAYLTGWLAPALFFGSVGCVGLHFALDLFFHGEWVYPTSRGLIFLAAAFPTVGAGIRTLREAHQFARNKARYRAKEVGMAHLDQVLQRRPAPEELLYDMEYCERVLVLEHREWARLMLETDVFPC